MTEPLRHQEKGPITKDSRAYVPCARCTAVARSAEPEYRGVIGIAKQSYRAHLRGFHAMKAADAARELVA